MIEEKELIGKCLKFNLEIVERNAWLDICKAASDETKNKIGLNYFLLNSAAATMVSAVDTLALNKVIGFGLDDNFNEENLKKIIKEFEMKKIPRFFLQVSPEKLDLELKLLLQKFNFTLYNKWAKLYRNAEEPVKDYDSDFVVEQIGGANAEKYTDILLKSFDWNEKLSNWFSDFAARESISYNKPGWIFYLGYYRNKPAATASMYIEGEYCWLGFAATLTEYRGLGAQHALIRQRIIDGIRSGCKHFIVETAENLPDKKSQSFLNLTDMGFKFIYARPNYIYYNKF